MNACSLPALAALARGEAALKAAMATAFRSAAAPAGSVRAMSRRKVCADVADVRARQGAIATTLPALKPYATIEGREVNRCER